MSGLLPHFYCDLLVFIISNINLGSPSQSARPHRLRDASLDGILGLATELPSPPDSYQNQRFSLIPDTIRPLNVAHILQNQIGVALTGLLTLGMKDRWRDLIFVVDSKTPSYSLRLYQCLGFKVETVSSEAVAGNRLLMAPTKLPLRAIAARVLRRHAVDVGLLSDSDTSTEAVFLARRGRRSLTNLGEIEPIVNEAGYRTVYAEDLDAEDQIKTIARAHSIFGLHGAAFGYLMFRNPQTHATVVECFPGGYAMNWARVICSEVGCTWLGGQGDLDARIVGAAMGSGSARAFESDDYRLEPRAATALLKMATAVNDVGISLFSSQMLGELEPVTISAPPLRALRVT